MVRSWTGWAWDAREAGPDGDQSDASPAADRHRQVAAALGAGRRRGPGPAPAASPAVQPAATLPVATTTTLPPPPELPRGGRQLFPRYRVVGFYGMQNLDALGQLMVKFAPDLLFVESGGDNLAAQFSRELADFTIYVIDVAGGDKIPRKGGP